MLDTNKKGRATFTRPTMEITALFPFRDTSFEYKIFPSAVAFHLRAWRRLEQRSIRLGAADLGQPENGLAHAWDVALAEHHGVQLRRVPGFRGNFDGTLIADCARRNSSRFAFSFGRDA